MKDSHSTYKLMQVLGCQHLFIWVMLVCPIFGFGQTDIKEASQIDAFFNDWNSENHPGGVVGVIKSNETIYLKAFGNASLEYKVPNNKSTLFNIGSISKQFTAMGIVLLQQKGLLSVDDKVQKYFPEFPIFSNPITLKHVLQHTSGLRDFHELMTLAGWRGDDYRTNGDVVRLLQMQTDLNFKPGEKFMYSNTGYVVLAEIIEKVTGEDFKVWMQNNVFEPLQLKRTYVEDNNQHIVSNRATSYYHSHDKVFEMAQAYWAYTGAGNMYSTTEDLLKWAHNFYNPKAGWEQSFAILQTLGGLTNGDPINYAYGIYIDEMFGKKRIQHAGVVGGYRTFLCIYPEEELSIVVLTNFSNAPFGERADDIAGVLLSETREKLQPFVRSAHQNEIRQQESSMELTDCTGTFYSPEIDTHYTFYQEGDTLKCSHGRHGEFTMEVEGPDVFKSSWPLESIKISRNQKGEVIGLHISTGRVKNLWFKKINSSSIN
ncbi:serine hydrolase domain-containing protein [Flagellimonas profundi]|uniref:Beta-lactamase family protein n=1 Tax=Flagellimonas profundi TaxID=2915620 RepID=A0ABS3FCH1_9FLAO|nr:serine hydrolase domain-containing protein [Allomuricauda profundi]MBO0340405.1 beta-lactamase family protein [Allomuricauda profundi]